jgi:hypothetical protein
MADDSLTPMLSRLVTSPVAFFVAGVIDVCAYVLQMARRRLRFSTMLRP